MDKYAEVLSATAAAVAREGIDAGARELGSIAGEIWMGRLTTSGDPGPSGGGGRRVGNEDLRAQVFIRDGFRCTLCGGPTVPRSILVAFHDLYPAELPYDAHYKRGRIHPVFWALAPEADHVLALSRGGANDLDNLTTLHAACNTRKSDALAEAVVVSRHEEAEDDWDGLTSSYAVLIDAGAGAARPAYHRRWLKRYTSPKPVVAP